MSTSFRKSLFVTGLAAACAAVPLTQALAQDTAPPQTMDHPTDNRTVPDKVADGWITTKVKSEFAASKRVQGSDISVDTADGVVSLAGTVASASERSEAIRIARGVKGVKRVNANGLVVGRDTGKPQAH
jgi:hyperosmotically inducible protein